MATARRPSSRRAAAGHALPPYVPQLATLVAAPPAGDEWVYEVKFDGFRMGLAIDATGARLLTRNGLDWSDRFPEIMAAARSLALTSGLLDGEVARLLPDGRTSFQGLQNASRAGGTLVYYLFDLLFVDGQNLAGEPLEVRKTRLRRVLPAGASPLRYSDHLVGNGAHVFAEACKAGLEGVIAKRRDQPWTGGRSRTWVKVKCLARQEFVIGGFTEPQGTREGLGALLIGHYDAGRLVWAGKVGTGFTATSAAALRARLEPLVQPTAPFSPAPRGALAREARWVRPDLVAEVAFTEWTDAGKIRHPSFQGLREDKPPTEVMRERVAATMATSPSAPRVSTPRDRTPAAPRRGAAPPVAASRRAGKAGVEVAGVTITHPDRVVYPDAALTKLDLARYYEQVGDWMLPHVAGRPLTLVFCPDGIGGECTYLKHGKPWGPKALRRVRIREKTKTGEYMVADTLAGLVSIMQMNWLETHTWNSTVDHLEQPDRLIFDLDPGPDITWAQVVAAARQARAALAARQLQSWVKTSGGRGLHVVVPLVPACDWAAGLTFAESVAADMVRDAPRRFTTNFSKLGREARILIDVMRNNRANTAIAAFSPRARAGAPVSTPLSWDELSTRRPPARFTVRTVPRRLADLTEDPWAAYWTCDQRLPPS